MKKIVILVFVFILYVVTADCSYAKKNSGLDMENQSVQFLKNLVDEGKELRKNDAPVKKADVEADTAVIRMHKQKYQEDNAQLLKVGN